MRITFLGTGAGSTVVGRAGSSIYVAAESGRLLLDCGPRSFDRFVDLGLSPEDVDAILVSHLHPDHVLGLPTFIEAMNFPFGKAPLVRGPAGTAQYVERAAAMTSLVTGAPGRNWGDPLDVPTIEVGAGSEEALVGFTIRSEIVPHAATVTALAWRLQGTGRRIVYSGDTAPAAETIVPLADGADLLIHESWSERGLDRWVAGRDPRQAAAIRRTFQATHSEVSAVARIAREAGVKRLVLTHLNPGERPAELVEAAGRLYPGEVIVAGDRLSLEL